jgi:hypothetical protein
VVKGDFVELNEDGSVKEEGLKTSGLINTAVLKDEGAIDSLIGQVGSTITINP